MKRQQFILVAAGSVLLAGLYLFGQTTPPRKQPAAPLAKKPAQRPADAKDILQSAKSKLIPSQLAYVNQLEKLPSAKAYRLLEKFWRDSVQSLLPAAYYLEESAKLENSEKSLTFAAQLFLNNLREQDDPVLKSWMANEAKELFERALQLNPRNDSSKIGLGSSYIFGGAADNPQEVMQGIQQILEVARRDSANMYAQFMLGLGGVESGQFDKAIGHFITVVRHEPGNIEAILTLAETYQRKGDRTDAIRWFEAGKKLIVNKDVIGEIDQRIKSLQ